MRLPSTVARRRGLAPAVALALCGAGTLAPPASAAPRTCLHRGERVIARSAAIEVVSTRPARGTIPGTELHGCSFASKRRFALGVRHDRIPARSLRVAGRFVAYEAPNDDTGDAGEGATNLYVTRIGNRRRERRVVDSHLQDGSPGTYPAFVVTRTGSLVYVARTQERYGVFRCAPWGCPSPGSRAPYRTPSPEALERTPGNGSPEPTRLRRVPGGVAWTTNGVRHTATLR